jgi:hypothetical protein
MIESKVLVATNPFHSVDDEGRPTGACPVDPRDPRFRKLGDVRGLVGAKREARLVREGMPGGGVAEPSARHEFTYQFRFAPFELHETRFYLRQIRDGGLIAANEETALLAGVRFVPVELARALAKSRSRGTAEVQWTDPPESAKPEQKPSAKAKRKVADDNPF